MNFQMNWTNKIYEIEMGFAVFLLRLLDILDGSHVVLTDNFHFECGRNLTLVARPGDARCDAIVQSVVRVFIQFIYVQIVANLLNAMVVTDECI